jgi:hypothetical protein
VVLSARVETGEPRWKDFVGKNEMTWRQYRDQALPVQSQCCSESRPFPPFALDADGILQDEHIEGGVDRGRAEEARGAAQA